ncbi:MAG TPA: hypothetical protein VK909_01215 [Anaerolineales bacterium]|nr:hypothetical protein [Anaerolineales bacterium]
MKGYVISATEAEQPHGRPRLVRKRRFNRGHRKPGELFLVEFELLRDPGKQANALVRPYG